MALLHHDLLVTEYTLRRPHADPTFDRLRHIKGSGALPTASAARACSIPVLLLLATLALGVELARKTVQKSPVGDGGGTEGTCRGSVERGHITHQAVHVEGGGVGEGPTKGALHCLQGGEELGRGGRAKQLVEESWGSKSILYCMSHILHIHDALDLEIHTHTLQKSCQKLSNPKSCDNSWC